MAKRTNRKATTATKSKRKAAPKKSPTRKKAPAKKRGASTKARASAKPRTKAGAKKPAVRAAAPKRAATRALSPIEFARMELKQPLRAAGDHHARLTPMAGEFRAVVRMWFGSGEPHVSTGVMVNSWDLGGRFLKQVYQGDGGEGPFPNFEGRGYWGYNDATERWEGFWVDNASTMMQVEQGEYDDGADQWTMTGAFTDPETGQPMRKRSVIRVLDHDRHTIESWFADPEGGERKVMEIEFERV